jgi:flavodoxin
MPRAIVVHYSRTGHTKALALEISRRLSEAGLRVDESVIRPVRELGTLRAVQCVLGRKEEPVCHDPIDLAGANVLLIGTPVWGSGIAPYMRRFLMEAEHLCGMPVVLFTTCSREDKKAAAELRQLVREHGGRPYAYEAWHIHSDGPRGLKDTAERVVRATLALLPNGTPASGPRRTKAPS